MKGFFKMEEKMMQDAEQKKELTEAQKKAMRKYQNNKRKKIACDVSIDLYEEIRIHAEKKGYNSLNSFIMDLIKNDMK